jgi:Tat protein translocase TatB subunit
MIPQTILFLDMGGGEIALIALVIFIVLGPDKIPEMARKFGKAMRFVRTATNDIKREINIDEDIMQKPRSYSHTTKTEDSGEAFEKKEPKPKKAEENEETSDNKSAN